jgi:lysophospholipase L1-like esterase
MKDWLILGRCVLGVVIFVVVLELCARVDDALSYGAPLSGPYSSENLFLQDQIGKRGRPGARYQKWRLNSLGYRGPELRSETIRIECIGASETFGLYEAEGREYPRQLERDLNSRARKDSFQVVNVALVGQTVATAALRVPETVDEIHPTIAIIYPSVADYIWLAWVRDNPVSSATSRMTDSGQPRVRIRIELRITERVGNLLKQALPQFVQTKLRQLVIDEDTVKNHYPIMDRVPNENVRRFQKDLLRLVAALRARGVEPVLVTHATVFGNLLPVRDWDLLVAWRKFYPMLREGGFLDMEQRMNDVIRAVASQEQILLIDASNEMPPGRKYFVDFSHFTTAGAEMMASLLADGLEPLIDARLSQGRLVAPSRPAELKKRH